MKVTRYTLAMLVSAAVTMPVWAHHNSPVDPDIGDVMGMHDAAIEVLEPMGNGSTTTAMDPADTTAGRPDVEDPEGLNRMQGGSMDQTGPSTVDQQNTTRSGR